MKKKQKIATMFLTVCLLLSMVPLNGFAAGRSAGASPAATGTVNLFNSDSAASVEINETNFPDANFRAYISGNIDTDQNGWLSETERAIYSLVVDNQNISSLQGIEFFPELQSLFCYDNALTSLDVSKNTALKTLYCQNDALTSLDVSENTALTKLDCSGNALTSLDVSDCSELKWLDCGFNSGLSEVVLPYTNAGWYQGMNPLDYADQFTEFSGGGTVAVSGGSAFLRKDAVSETVLHKNDGTGEKRKFITENQIAYRVTIFKTAFASPAGKELASWNTRADGTGTSYADNDFIGSVVSDLYAQWQDMDYSGFAVENIDVRKASDGLTVNADLVCTSNVGITAYAAAYDSNGKMLGIGSLSNAGGRMEFSIALSAGSDPAKVKVFLTQQGSSAPICCAEHLLDNSDESEKFVL